MTGDDIQADFEARISAFVADLAPCIDTDRVAITATARGVEDALFGVSGGVTFIALVLVMKRFVGGMDSMNVAVVMAAFMQMVVNDDEDEDEDEEGNEP